VAVVHGVMVVVHGMVVVGVMHKAVMVMVAVMVVRRMMVVHRVVAHARTVARVGPRPRVGMAAAARALRPSAPRRQQQHQTGRKNRFHDPTSSRWRQVYVISPASGRRPRPIRWQPARGYYLATVAMAHS